MVRVVVPFICLLFMVSFTAAQPPREIEQFLASRQVIGQIFFPCKVTTLSSQAESIIDQRVPELKALKRKGKLLRIEGFASADGNPRTNSQLSLERALAVKDYLKDRHQMKLEVFLTGFGESLSTDGKIGQERRVDIAVYELTPAAEMLFNESGQIERYPLQ